MNNLFRLISCLLIFILHFWHELGSTVAARDDMAAWILVLSFVLLKPQQNPLRFVLELLESYYYFLLTNFVHWLWLCCMHKFYYLMNVSFFYLLHFQLKHEWGMLAANSKSNFHTIFFRYFSTTWNVELLFLFMYFLIW